MTRILALALGAAVASLSLARPSSAQCDPKGDCLEPHPLPGCSDPECCETVCILNPLCCSLAWDANCAAEADANCVGLCGATASGDCAVPRLTPGCNRRECCELVCDIEPFCCEVRWDIFCTLLASKSCLPEGSGTCGDPSAGSCFEPHSTPACDQQACCELVCIADPSCCTSSWDLLCASVASQVCVDACEPSCPVGSIFEDEDCGQDSNNPCYGTPSPFPVIQQLPCGTWACGRIASDPGGFRDIDVWEVVVSDGDGDGVVPVRLSLASSFGGFAALVPLPCGSLEAAVAKVETDFCVEFGTIVTCVPPGTYRVAVAPGAFPNPGNPLLACGAFGATRYRVRLECLPSGCGPACGPGAGSCYTPRKLPGCEDPECCDLVCDPDPACCDVQWDTECVRAAQKTCAAPPPNDECTGAIAFRGESIVVSTIGATASLPLFDTDCGGQAIGSDVWLRMTATRTADCTLSTCGSGEIDTAIAIYGSCGTARLACNDDGAVCVPKTASRVTFAATCGIEYLIRLGARGGQPGSATLEVSYDAGPGCSCTADLDGDGAVGGGDLTMLLSSWGGPDGDLDGDGTTGAADLTEILSAWGPCP